MRLAIDPDTTVGALLQAYPQVESVLLGMAPAFAKLRNPVVRRTVAKVATLEQAARIGGVSLQDMIRRLREAAGHAQTDFHILEPASEEASDASWLTNCRVLEDLDADAMLERGVHPIGRIRELTGALRGGEAVVLRSSFRPQPLIETMRRAGVAVHYSLQGTIHRTWFGKPER